jgi:hypothetical protein
VFEVEWDRIERVLFNVMKGIFYVSQKRPLPKDFILCVKDVQEVEEQIVGQAASFMVPWQSFGDSAFACRYVVSSKEPIEKMTCLIQLYQNRIFLGEAISPALLGLDGELFVPAQSGSPILVPKWSAERR